MNNWINYTILLVSFIAFAQEKDKSMPKANKQFLDKDYVNAEANYRISQSKNTDKATAIYNLGNAIYRQNIPGEAKYAYARAIENAQTKQEKHLAFHNIGNVFMKEKDYQNAVEAYKNALRNNPNDEETRYNYALARKFLKDNPPPPQDDKKDQDKNQKDKQDQKDKEDKDKDEKDKGDKGDEEDKSDKGEKDKNEDKRDGDKKDKAPPKESGASKQQIENLLDAVNNEEKKIQDKVNAQKVKGRPVKQEKDW